MNELTDVEVMFKGPYGDITLYDGDGSETAATLMLSQLQFDEDKGEIVLVGKVVGPVRRKTRKDEVIEE